MKVSLIAAVARNGVIGSSGGGLPWKLPRDARHFRSHTSGKWMLLGRKTYLEMAGWFTDQTPIVLSRSEQLRVPGGYLARSVLEAISLARRKGAEELVISGGAEVYRAALPFAGKMILTRIDAEFVGEARFPDFDPEKWMLVNSEAWPTDPDNPHPVTIETYALAGQGNMET